MTAISDAYSGTVASKRSRRRLYLGVGLFLTGAALVIAGIVAAGSGLLTNRGFSLGEARWIAGIVGGIGVPAVFLGIFTILPANRTTRATALIGASIAMFGVALFAHAYPCQWIGNTCDVAATDLTLPTAGIYFFGTLTTFWCLFTGVANFKTRNDPGGTVNMEITKLVDGTTEETTESAAGGFGSVGLFGTEPDGDVATQTNADPTAPAATAATSDGGATTQQISSPVDSSPTGAASTATGSDRTLTGTANTSTGVDSTPAGVNNTSAATDSASPASTDSGVDHISSGSHTQSTASNQRSSGASTQSQRTTQRSAAGTQTPPAPGVSDEDTVDRYCGSCAQFKYVRTDDGLQPYCAHHDELMDDMESCSAWEPR